MDRRFVYNNALGQDVDVLKPQVNAMVALGYMAQSVLGTNTVVDGLAITPSSPADLSAHVGAGSLYQLENIDDAAFATLGTDLTHSIVKQGVNLDSWTGTVTPPAIAGQAMNYLVQASFLEQDIDSAVIPYYNPASADNANAPAWSGPNNSGVAQPQTRKAEIQLSLKAGVAATAGSQTTPAPDVGYVGLYVITVAQGATQITTGQIARYTSAPFIDLKLPDVPRWVQGGSYAWGVDSGSANALVAALSPVPTQYTTGMLVCIKKIASANTGAMTANFNGLGSVAILDQTGSPLTSGAVPAGVLMDLRFDGTAFRFMNGSVTYTSVSSITAISGEGITVDGTSHAVSLNLSSLSTQTPGVGDLFVFYAQGDTHHRVITYANLIAALATQEVLSWDTPHRPTSPLTGKHGFNTTLGYEEVWDGTAWVPVGINALPSFVGTSNSAYPAGTILWATAGVASALAQNQQVWVKLSAGKVFWYDLINYPTPPSGASPGTWMCIGYPYPGDGFPALVTRVA